MTCGTPSSDGGQAKMAEGVTPLSGPSGLLGCVYLHRVRTCRAHSHFIPVPLRARALMGIPDALVHSTMGVSTGERAMLACLLVKD